MATKTPIEPGILARAITGVKYMLNGKANVGWFGPGQPIAPQAQNEEGVLGRMFDFRVGVNTVRTPRDAEGISFTQLRALADSCDLLRLVIETRKDQMTKLKWTIKHKDTKKKPDPKCEEIENFLRYPDQQNDWETWLRAVLEDMFVIDAATVYPRMNMGGGLYALELMDGSTVKKILDQTGRTPLPPEPAYQQILKGISAANYSRDELVYRPRNIRTNKAYGYSHVEQVVMTVNIAIRRSIHQLQYYTEGNVPEMLMGVPETWNPDQISKFQSYWDLLLEGDTAQRRHMKFVPGGMKSVATKEAALKDTYDEWLARIICYAFSTSPSALVSAMNRATAEQAHTQALQEGLAPTMSWVKSMMDYIIVKYFDAADLQFVWDEEDSTSQKEQMDILTGYVKAKIITDDEARDELGYDPLTEEQRGALAPPPVPGAVDENGDPIEPDPDAPGSPGAVPGSASKPPGAPKPQPEGNQAGKYQSSGLRKSRHRLPRNRAVIQKGVATTQNLVQQALNQDKERIAKELSFKINKFFKADDNLDVEVILNSISLDALIAAQPELQDVFESVTIDGGKEALAQVLAQIDESQLNQVNARAVVYAKERSAELVTQLSDSTRDLLRSDIVAALEDRESTVDFSKILSENYGFSEARAKTIARTEMAYADVQGNLIGWKESGVVVSKQWLTSSTEGCDICEPLNEVIVGIDDDFPGDAGDGPPIHPNCECDIVPIVNEEE